MNNKQKRVGIVILNYETYEESIDCVDSIKRHKLRYDMIVIVDNASSNNSYSLLNTHYKDDDQIHIIQAKENLGFARGNNEGILYLRKMGIEYILLLNSDTVILTDDYLDKMIESGTSDVGVVGSEIGLLHGLTQGGEQEDFSFRFMLYDFIRCFCKQYYIYFPFVYKRDASKSLRVHGCAILLTPAFFNKYECLWPYTYLYREEMILSIMAEKVGLKTKIADTKIFHKGQKTTGKYWAIYSKKRERLELKSNLQQIMVKILPHWAIKSVIRSYANENKT